MDKINEEEILKPLRAEIDHLDRELIALLAKRFDVVHRVGEIKKKYNLSPIQPKRMEQVLERVASLAEEHHIDPDFVKNLYHMMIDHAHALEFEITGQDHE